MRKHLQLILATAFLALLPFSLTAQSIRFITWNVKSFECTDDSGNGSGFPITEHVNLIKTTGADVIVMNEFESFTSRMTSEKMADLGRELGMFTYFIESYVKNEGWYGNVILSKYPIVSYASQLHPYENETPGKTQGNNGDYRVKYGEDQRSVGYADILVNGKTVRIVCTHLDHVGNTQVLQNQVKSCVELASLDKPVYPTIVAGDMNTGGTSAAMTQFNELGDYVTVNRSGIQGYANLDHIYTFPKGKWTASEARYYNQGKLSDHSIIAATLTLND
ncbi:MAG: endonuclease/exonuclease/phosphatase family protein [Bacteroidales bacterium]|nr:endonuclease/exonuclease/phosphatase family protein [Bacteroidales bacterium]